MKKVVLGVFAFIIFVSFNNTSESIDVTTLEKEDVNTVESLPASCEAWIEIYDSNGIFVVREVLISNAATRLDCRNQFFEFIENIMARYPEGYTFSSQFDFNG